VQYDPYIPYGVPWYYGGSYTVLDFDMTGFIEKCKSITPEEMETKAKWLYNQCRSIANDDMCERVARARLTRSVQSSEEVNKKIDAVKNAADVLWLLAPVPDNAQG